MTLPDETAPPIAQPPPRRTRRPRRLHIGDAIAKLVKAQRGIAADVPAVRKCLEHIIATLEHDGDHDEATLVREAYAFCGGPATAANSRTTDGVFYTPPTPNPGDFVLDPGSKLDVSLRVVLESLLQVNRLHQQGVEAASRVLMHGPSGVGKTAATRWLAAELGLAIHETQLGRAVDSHMGETSRKIVTALEEVTRAPCIVFLDELDAICGVRASTTSNVDAEYGRVTSALLQMFDRLPSSQIIIAATNLIDRVDPALRRRFHYEIVFEEPTERVRALLVDAWLRNATELHVDGRVPGDVVAAFVERGQHIHKRLMSAGEFRMLVMGAARRALLAREPLTEHHVAMEYWRMSLAPEWEMPRE